MQKTVHTQPLSSPERETPENDQPKKRMYVFVDAVSEEELLADLQERADGEESTEKETQAPLPWATGEQVAHPGTRKPARLLLLVIPLCLFAFLAMLAGGCVYVFFFQSVTVTITPDIRHTETTGTITIVTAGSPDTTNNQIPGRVLPSLTMSQSQTTATTGLTNQPARAGWGIITFYNASTVSQTIVANTLLTGADGVQVATDYTVTVPAETLPLFGSVNVTAHALQKGTAGNIKAGDVSGSCCLLNIQVANSAFSGGQEAENYQSVAQADIDTTAANLKTTLLQSVTTALQSQVNPGESLVTPLSCQPTVAADHKEGEKATQVQVTLTEACTAVTYDSQAFNLLLRRIQTQAAGNDLTKHYRLEGEVHAAIQSVTEGSTPGTYQLSVQTTGTWVYTFSQSQQHHLAAQIAGKSPTQATHTLLHTPGIRRVSFGSGVPALPIDPRHIRFLFLIQQ